MVPEAQYGKDAGKTLESGPGSPYAEPSTESQERLMTDNLAKDAPNPGAPTSIAGTVARTLPMGDLDQFLIEDLTPGEEDILFGVLEQA